MKSDILKFVAINILFLLLLSPAIPAEQIKRGDIPEPCKVCTGVALEYGDIDTCWPGEIISVPVYYTSGDTLNYLQIWGTLPAGMSYSSYDTAGTPWTGGFTNLSSGSTIEIHLNRGDTLLPATMERILDINIQIASDEPYDQIDTIKFGHNIAAAIFGESIDCDVTDTTGGIVIIPEDSVYVTFDSANAYSYQGADGTDQAKTDNPLKVPVKLYSNFPLEEYTIWFEVPDSLTYVGYDSKGAGAQVAAGTGSSYKIYGTPASKPGNDSTYYLCDLKFKVGDYYGIYNSNHSFHDSIFINFSDGGAQSPKTHVYSWGAADSICYDSIDSYISEGVYLPEYEVLVDIKDATVNEIGIVNVPVTMTPTFWAQFNKLNVEFDSTLLEYIKIDSVGGNIPPVGNVVSFDHSGNYARKSISCILSPTGYYILPDTEQTIFSIKFHAKTFPEGSTQVRFFAGPSSSLSEVHDFFSRSNDKIIRDEDSTSTFSMSNGTVTNPSRYSVSAGGPEYYDDYIVRLEINTYYISVYNSTLCMMVYDDHTPEPDSVTSGDWTISDYSSSSSSGYVYLLMEFSEAVDDSGKLADIWVTTQDGSVFALEPGECWSEFWYQEYWDTVEVDVMGGSVYYEWQQPKLNILKPDEFALGQNYPNPFNAVTNITFNLPTPEMAELKIFDILGRQIKTLESGQLPAGNHIISWNGTNDANKPIAAGVYFYTLDAGKFHDSRKMLYLK